MVKTFPAGPQALLGREGPKVVRIIKIAFRAAQNRKETLGFIGKTHMEKTNAQNLIKPVEYEDFLSQNRKMASKMIKKALRL